MTRPNPKLAKLHRSYTVDEVARLYGAHRNTVRGWLKAGLSAIDDRRPVMIQGHVLRAFLQDRRERAKRPCAPGTLYCCKCRAPRATVPGSVAFESRADGAGTLSAHCELCGTRMFRRTRQQDLRAIMPQVVVLIVQGPLRIAECASPSLNCDKRQNGST